MPKSQIGAQMYTLREHLKTPVEMARTCRRVKQIGYDAIQVSAFGPIEVQELAKVLDGEGLECAATHVSLDQMRDTARCVDYHATLKCRHPAIGGFWPEDHHAAAYEQFAREFAHIGAALARQGMSGAGYHNHSRELSNLDGRCVLELLIDHTAPPFGVAAAPAGAVSSAADAIAPGASDAAAVAAAAPPPGVWFEIDTYWIAHGGGDPAAWIDKVAGRIPCVHLKDMAVTPRQEQKMCEVGSGNLNWPRILEACRRAGVEWYLIERDSGDLDPFESLKVSLENLRAMGVR